MKRLILVAALTGALAACGDAAEEADDTTAVEMPAAAEPAVAESSAGTYEYEFEGKATVAVLNPDGTYADSQDGQVIESGTWEDRDDGKTCFDPEGDEAPVTCFTVTEPDAQGVFTATPDDGTEPLTIKRVS